MWRQVTNILKKCDLCQKSKVINYPTHGYLQSILPREPFEIVSVDLYGELPASKRFKYILVALDIFSKYIKLYPIVNMTAKTVADKIINHYIPKVAKPHKILSDNGRQFVSREWRERLAFEGIQVVYTSPYHPEANPVEREMREIGRIMRAFAHKRHNIWSEYVLFTEQCLNQPFHSSIGCTPYEVVFREPPPSPFKQVAFPQDAREKVISYQTIRRNLEHSAAIRNKYRNLHLKPRQFKIGDQVLIRNHQLSSGAKKEIKKIPFTVCWTIRGQGSSPE